SVLALTATYSSVDVEIIQSILERPNMKVIRTSIIHHPEITLEIKPKLIAKNKFYQIIFDLLDNLEGRMYHEKLTTFGMGININDVTLIIHTTLPMSYDQYIQEIGQAGRFRQQSRAILFYSRSDICTLLTILSN
ncbi:15177_t:CDS:2, partial [Funneliformis mosseae]